ncbi:MAG: DNA/RNA non-specific endonuclease [Ignavibacteriae bacterium HGW-Ignavibacteriae-1]|nr:MAG: DNA/RNA non-specific endonuclease [Ignavibacteriae bacterium HGW-Ignavibacteriae-1]
MSKLSFLIAFLSIVSFVQVQSQYYEIHCKHFIYGYPVGSSITNDLIIRDSYALSSNDSTKFADWVCYYLDSATMSGNVSTSRVWKADPWLDDDETLEPDDYKGANAALKTDRGHQAPLANFKGNRDWHTTNYLSNITPQNSKLNQGVWKNLEELERRIVADFKEIYVMTGPLYERYMPRLPYADEQHIIPSGYWKIITSFDSKNNLLVAAFIFDQTNNLSQNLADHCVSVREIEARSGLDFYNLLEYHLQEMIENPNNCDWILR